MRYNHIKRVLSAALLLAFAAPAGITYPMSGGYSSYDNGNSTYSAGTATSLSLQSQLTNNNEKITLSLRDSDVKQVLRMFADKAGKNIVFHSSVNGNVTLDLVDMPINDAFALVLQICNLNYYLQNNTIIVLSSSSSDNAMFSKQEMMVFPVKYVGASKIADFLNKNVFGMKKAGMSGIDAATVNAATNELIVFGMPSDAAIVEKVIAQLDKEPTSRTFYVNHSTPGEMADMICNFLLPAHGVGKGGNSGGNDGYVPPTPAVTSIGVMTGGAASTSSSSSSNAKEIKLGEGIVACSISQSSSGAVSGFDLQNIAISYYPQKGTIVMMGGSLAQQKIVEEFIKTNDTKQPQAFLEVSIVELNEDGSKEFYNEWSFQTKAWGFKFKDGNTNGGRYGGYYDVWAPITRGGWIETKDSSGQVTGWEWKTADGYAPRAGLIGNRSYLEWQMHYLIENKKARMLANPKILITNGQESIIDLTEDYIEKVTSEFLTSTNTGGQSGASSGAVQKTYTIGKDKGIKVSLVPFISPEGYVTMNIKPEYATEAGTVLSDNEAGGKDIGATLLNRRNLDLKNVRIKDGETLIIGGLIKETESKTVQKIPVLGDLPLIGAAFRSSKTGKTKSELVIMITPRVLKDGDDVVADRL